MVAETVHSKEVSTDEGSVSCEGSEGKYVRLTIISNLIGLHWRAKHYDQIADVV